MMRRGPAPAASCPQRQGVPCRRSGRPSQDRPRGGIGLDELSDAVETPACDWEMAARNRDRISGGEYADLSGTVSSGRLIAWHTLRRKSSRACARGLECDLSLSSTAQTTDRSLARQTTKSKCLAAMRLSAPWRAELPRPGLTVAMSATRTLPKTRCSGPTAWSRTPRKERSAGENRVFAGW